MQNKQPASDGTLNSFFKAAAKIKFKGLSGKLIMALIVGIIAIAGIVMRLNVEKVSLIGICLIFVLLLAIGGLVIWFANKHPTVAILEGAEFLRHEEIVMASKQSGQIPIDITDYREEKSVNELPGIQLQIESSDKPPKKTKIPKRK